MRSLLFFGALAISALTTANLCSAAQLSAGDLFEFCTSSDLESKNVCQKYILGATEGMNLTSGKFLGVGRGFCIPELDERALTIIFTSKAMTEFQAYPEDSKSPAISILGAIMLTTFPCPADHSK